MPITSVPQTFSEIIANANPLRRQGLRPLEDITSINFTRDGMTYLIDYEYLSRNSQIQNFILHKDGDVIHMPDNSLNQVYILGETQTTSLSLSEKNIPLSLALAEAKGLNQSI